MSTAGAAIAVESRLLRALTVLRLVLLANAVGLNIYRSGDVDHPFAAAGCVLAMVAWTGYAAWAYVDPRRRTRLLLVADLGVAVALLAATPLVKGGDFDATIPGFWIAGAMLAWAIHFRLRGGLVAGLVLAATDLALRQQHHASDYNDAFLLVIAGPVVGFMCGSLQQMATERDAAERSAARAAERARLARVVHDGTLQVLALVQRRGHDLGGEAAELGALAAHQEQSLRSLLRASDAATAAELSGAPAPGELDLVTALSRLERPGVTVSAPGFAIELPAPVVTELVAAVDACLANVRCHVGQEAPAWVLLEAAPERIEVTVRDEGPGIPAGRLEEAEAEGRLGVSGSIRGRLADLGGTATVTSGSYGTEWSLVLPRTTLREEAR
ncbi:MAG: MacS family sensor histidine kinase [Nocardioides sp.]